MRRRASRRRDTFDAVNLAYTPDTDLNHRTQPYSDRTDRIHTLFILAWQIALPIALVLPTELLAYIPMPAFGAVFLPFIAWHLVSTFFRFLRSQPLTKTLVWAGVIALAGALYWLLSLDLSKRQVYLLVFGPSVAVATLVGHVIARQFAFWMSVNVRLEKAVMERWQGYWSYIRKPVTPDDCPEVESVRAGFLFPPLAFAAGYLALVKAEEGPLADYAGLLSLGTFAAALILLWSLWSVAGPVPFMSPFRVARVSWQGLVTWASYNRHQTVAPGVFQFPTVIFRRMRYRYLATLVPMSLLTFSVWHMQSNIFGDLAWGAAADFRQAATQFNMTFKEVEASFTPTERAWFARLSKEPDRLAYLREVQNRRSDLALTAALPRWTAKTLGRTGLIFVVAITGPGVLFFLLLATTTGRLLVAYHEALEAPDAYEVKPDAWPWDNRVHRMLTSKNKAEREHVYLGRSVHGDYPVLLHLPLLHQHAHILGDTGSRKTSVGIAPLLTQLIARADSSVLILDLKGDKGLFESARIEADRAGLPFKFFTNISGRTSHVFNPLRQSHTDSLTIHQRTQAILQALALEYGEDYGAGYYSAINEIVLKEYLARYRDIGSINKLHQFVKDSKAYKSLGGVHEDWKNARHLAILLDKLSSVYPLNVSEDDLEDKPRVWQERIDMPDLLKTKQVVYFYLSSAIEPTTVSPVARLAMFNLLTAAAPLEGSGNRVYVFVDEFQRIITENVRLFLEQARSMKLHFILANQTIGQLKGRALDLVDTVESCTAYKHLFKATDLETLDRLEQAGGQALYHENQWEVFADDGYDPRQDLDYGDHAARRIQVREALGPRLERNTLIELSAASWLSLVRFTEGSGFTQYSGYFTPIVHEFHIPFKEFEFRTKEEWPRPDEKTLLTPTATVTNVPTMPTPTPTVRSIIDRLNEHAATNGKSSDPEKSPGDEVPEISDEETHEPASNYPA
jgi:hypothetical protein